MYKLTMMKCFLNSAIVHCNLYSSMSMFSCFTESKGTYEGQQIVAVLDEVVTPVQASYQDTGQLNGARWVATLGCLFGHQICLVASVGRQVAVDVTFTPYFT